MAYSKNEQKSIRYGYLWHWGSIGCILLIPFLAVAIAKSCEAVSETQEFLFLFSMGILWLSCGIYQLTGTALSFKHILVSLQISKRGVTGKREKPNPRKTWTKSEKRTSFSIGIIDILIGTAFIIISLTAV